MSPRRGRRWPLPGAPGFHWYWCRASATRTATPSTPPARRSSDLHDRLWEQTGLGPEATVLGGFSMGSVMSYAMGLGADRPPVAGLLAFSGFVPTVDGWGPQLR